jgi:hypothetical protein
MKVVEREQARRLRRLGWVCGTPPDLAPTAPTAVCAAFAALAPPLARSGPPGCRERIDDPARTMLGEPQLARFARDLRASTARWKIVMNEVPLQQFYANPYDRWEATRPSARKCSS